MKSYPHIGRFMLTLAVVLSLLIVTFVSLANPDFEWWSIGVAMMANIPLAYLLVWICLLFTIFLEKKGVSPYLRYLILLGALIWMFLIIRQFHISVLSPFIHFPVGLSRTLLPAIVVSVLLVQFIELYLYRQRIQRESEEKAEYQRMMLRRQLSPHFLFNSLNVLSSLTHQDADTANRFTKKLSHVYRYILDTQDKTTVLLADELRFVQDYAYLQHIRYGHAVQVSIEGTMPASAIHVIPGSVQQMVENAIKHNVATEEQPLHVVIRMDEEHIVVSNNLQLRPDAIAHGTGLANLQKQYAQLGKKLQIAPSEKVFTVTIPYV